MRAAMCAFVLLSTAGLVSAQTPNASPTTTTPAKNAAPSPAPAASQPAQAAPAPPAQAQPQTSAPQGQPAQAQPAPAAAAPATPPPAPVDTFTYSPDGRRDPFVNLLGAGGISDSPRAGRRAEGAGGFGVNEISVRGILQSRGTLVAMIQGPDNRTYVVHQGDKLADGTIKSVTAQGLIVVQEVNDPLSLVKQREVSKLLRSLEGVK